MAFGGFAGLASVYAAAACLPLIGLTIPSQIEQIAGCAAALAGLVGVFCSVKIYADTRRPFWDILISGPKFFATALVLGLPVALSVALAATLFSNAGELHAMMIAYGRLLCGWTVGITAAKLAFEALIFVWLLRRQPTPLKRTALLMTGELRKVTTLRFVCGAVGGLLLPAVLLMEDRVTSTGYPAALFAVVRTSDGCLAVGRRVAGTLPVFYRRRRPQDARIARLVGLEIATTRRVAMPDYSIVATRRTGLSIPQTVG